MNGSRKRDQSVERLLRQSLPRSSDDPRSDVCLDAETMAAWIGGHLLGPPLAVARSHVADCERCQSVLGELIRIDAAITSSPSWWAARSWWTPRQWARWLTPLAAAAAAFALWFSIPRNPASDVPQKELAQAPASLPATAPDAAVNPQTAPSVDSLSTPALKAEPTPAPTQGNAAAGRGQTPAATAQSASAAAAPAPPPAPARRDAGRLEADARSQSSSVRQGSAPAKQVAPLAAPAAPPPQALGASPLPSASAEKAVAAPSAPGAVEILSPNPSIRWRIVGAAVERSNDGGRGWETLSTGTATELTAGMAPTESVCWLVGRDGLVLITTDGRTWRRVVFPETTDLKAVSATDANTASVITSDGRVIGTTDGGARWSQ